MIDFNKRYRLKDGASVKLIGIFDELGGTPIVGIILGERPSLERWTLEGNFFENGIASRFDLVEVSPYGDFQIDDKVLVRDNQEDDWQKRHFAGVSEDGRPLAFIEGRTSFTTDNKLRWNFCIKYNPSMENTNATRV